MLDTAEADRDARLLARFAAGDQAAARELTESLLPNVLRQAWRMLGDEAEAEDVAQEAMLRLWRQAEGWRVGEAKVSTWLYRVTHNLCIDRLRRRRSGAVLDEVPDMPDESLSVLERIGRAQETRQLARAIGDLPGRQRQALLMRHFEGAANPEIAVRLDCSVEAVESLLARARRQLHKRMLEERSDVDAG